MILRNVETLGPSGVRDVVIAGGEASSIVFDGALAFPGLINSHDHLEFNCYGQLGSQTYCDYVEWGASIHRQFAAQIAAVEAIPRALRVEIGILKNLLCGVTCVAHHGSPVELARSPVHVIDGTHSIHSPRLGRLRRMLVPDRRIMVAHVGEGVNATVTKEIEDFIRWNIWRKRLVGVHAIGMRVEQARCFRAIVWCPVSNEFLFGCTAPVAELKRYTTILFGTDSTLTASWNIWDHIRRARELGSLTDEELIAALADAAASTWKLTGWVTDIVVARKRHQDPREAFFATNPEDILLVVKRGRIVLLDASLRSQLPAKACFFPITVNGVEKFSPDNYSELLEILGSTLRLLPIPVRA